VLLAEVDIAPQWPSWLEWTVVAAVLAYGSVMFYAGLRAGRIDREQRRADRANSHARVLMAAQLDRRPPDPVTPVEHEGRHHQRYDTPRQPQLLPADDVLYWPINREPT